MTAPQIAIWRAAKQVPDAYLSLVSRKGVPNEQTLLWEKKSRRFSDSQTSVVFLFPNREMFSD